MGLERPGSDSGPEREMMIIDQAQRGANLRPSVAASESVPSVRRLMIVHVITRLLRAGAEENTLASCLHQLAAGHDVIVVYGAEFDESYRAELPTELRLIQVPELVQPVAPGSDVAALLAMRRLFRRLRPDVIHTHQSKAGILGRLAAWRSGAAIVHTVHIVPFVNVGFFQRIVYILAERLCASFTHRMVSVSNSVQRLYLDRGIGHPGRHAVVRSGMELDRFARARAPEDWKARIGGWHAEARPFIVLMLAAFEPRKKQEAFLRALAPALRGTPDLYLLFAGAGPCLNDCRALSSRLELDKQVRFLGHDREPESLIALADLCVLASEREGLPRSIIQYVAANRPVVVASLPGIEEVIESGVNGVVVAGGDHDAVAAEVLRLHDDRQALERLQSGARATDVSAWDVARMSADLDRVYDEALLAR